MADAIANANLVTVDRFKAINLIDDCPSHIKESFAFRIGGWLNAKLIGTANSGIRSLEREGYDVTKCDAKTVRALLLGADGEDEFVPEAQAHHALLTRIAGWGAVPKLNDTITFMTRPGKESRISRELILAALQMRGKRAPKNCEERVEQLLKLDTAKEQASARALAEAAPNVMWMVEHIFGDYGDADETIELMSDDGVNALDMKLLTTAKHLADDAMLNAVKQIGDWSLGDVRLLDDLIDNLENL
jgi:hypothetical protein